jgi:hypothetical protein
MVRLCVETDGLGFQVFNTFATESAHVSPTRELASRFYPTVPIRGELGPEDSLVSNRKARETLGFDPKHRWREEMAKHQDSVAARSLA